MKPKLKLIIGRDFITVRRMFYGRTRSRTELMATPRPKTSCFYCEGQMNEDKGWVRCIDCGAVS